MFTKVSQISPPLTKKTIPTQPIFDKLLQNLEPNNPKAFAPIRVIIIYKK